MDERAEIEAATDRLLDGIPLRSDGNLTIVSLAAETGVKRHVLTHEHTDLKDRFNAGSKPSTPSRPAGPRSASRTTNCAASSTTCAPNATSTSVAAVALARALNVLTAENDKLRSQISRHLVADHTRPAAAPSTVEDRPADLVPQPLVVQDEFANRIRELFALPAALEPSGALSLACGHRRTRSLDRVGRSTQLVCSDMRHHRGLAGSERGVTSRSAHHSCRSHGMAARCAGPRHPDLAASPCPNLLDRLTRPGV
jgi:hypothetical protein